MAPEFTPSGKSAKAESAKEFTGVSYRIDDVSYTYSKSNKPANGGEALFYQEEQVMSSSSEAERMHTVVPNSTAKSIDESYRYSQLNKSGEEGEELYYHEEEQAMLSTSEAERMHTVVPNIASKSSLVQSALVMMSLCFILIV